MSEDSATTTAMTGFSVSSNDSVEVLKDYSQNIIGFYLALVGVLGTLGNGAVLTMFIRFRSLMTPTAMLLVNLAVADLGMSLGNCPFSASSSFAHRWLFGDGGCQVYAFSGFLFGTAHIGTLTMLAFDRFVVTCKTSYRGKLTYRRYAKFSILIWVFAAFWAAMPLVGWARYSLEPSVTTCTIDWRHNDISYKSFLVTYFLLGYAAPMALMVYCYVAAGKRIRTKKMNLNVSTAEQWANENNVTYMCAIVLAMFVFAWTPYAVLCLWTVVSSPESVPQALTLLPPLFAKTSTVFNPLIYYVTNPRLRAGLLNTITCCCRKSPGEAMEMLDTSPPSGTTESAEK